MSVNFGDFLDLFFRKTVEISLFYVLFSILKINIFSEHSVIDELSINCLVLYTVFNVTYEQLQQQLLSADDVIRANINQDSIYIVAVILAGTAALACVLCTFCATVVALRFGVKNL